MAEKSERQPIGKKVRFEVFKRDNFTCQYCGARAPDVVLEVDHITPVAGGGENDIMNLVTACKPCNAGKGARELSDQSTLEKQRQQLEELSERREQLEMMISWREGLADLTEDQVNAFEQRLEALTGSILSETGRQSVRKWLKRYSIGELLETLETSCDQYVKWSDDGEAEVNSIGKAIDYVPRILSVQRRGADKPYLKDLYYIRGILRNRLHYISEVWCFQLLEEAHLAGASIEALRSIAKTVNSWSAFRNEIEEFLEEHGGEE